MADVQAQKEELKSLLGKEGLDQGIICFKEEPLDDALQRFLQARKFKVEDAAAQIRNATKWRTEFAAVCVRDGKAACLGADVEEVAQFYRGNYAGHCKEGRPIWYEQTGHVDIAALHCLTSDAQFIRYHVCLMEELQDKYAESSKAQGRTVNKTFSILDMEGVTMSKLSSETLDFVKAIAKVDSENYPETMGKMVIINSPGVFSFAWNIIKAFLDPRTVSKIEILGGPAEWKPRLAEFIDPDQLPLELGGTGPACLPTTKCFTEVTLASGTTTVAKLEVKQGDRFKFKFFTRGGTDIGFKLSMVIGGNTELPLVPHKAYPGTECSSGKNVAGELVAPSDGVVVATWDHPNWWSRELLYRLALVGPADTAAAPAPDSAPADTAQA